MIATVNTDHGRFGATAELVVPCFCTSTLSRKCRSIVRHARQERRALKRHVKSAYLVTGSPGVGKTTLIRQVLSTMRMRAGGFYTEDLRNSGSREGFRIVTLEGETALLAATGHPGPVHVSKYGVAVDELDRVGVSALKGAHDRGHIMVVDEIGRMQLFSREFRQIVFGAVKEGHPILGTIMAGRNPYADRIKTERNVELLELTPETRQEVLDFLRSKFV